MLQKLSLYSELGRDLTAATGDCRVPRMRRAVPQRRTHRYREEAINVQLANILTERGFEASGETVRGRARPDVLVNLQGLKLVLEGRVASQRTSLFRDAAERVESGVADISMAVLYPQDLQTAAGMRDLTRRIERARFSGGIFYPSSDGVTYTPFNDSGLDELIEAISTVFWLRVQNDVVREQVGNLQATIESVVNQAAATHVFFGSEALVQRLNQALGISGERGEEESGGDGD